RVLSVKDVYNIFESREIMEEYGIRKSIEHLTHKDIKTLDNLFEQLTGSFEKGDVNEYCQIDTDLHYMLFEMSENELIYEIVTNGFPLLQPFTIITINSKNRFEESFEEHKGLIQGIKEKNFKKAWEHNKTHLRLARDVIINHIKSLE